MSDFHGRFCWYELMTTDVPAAIAFYGQVVGWGTRDGGNPGMDYTIWTAGETGVGGVMAWPDPKDEPRPGWMGYVAVDDVDASHAQLLEFGGKPHRAPWDIPGVGRLAVVGDPDDAVFVLFTPAPGSPIPPPPLPGTPGFIGWRELMAKDWAKAWEFYAVLFDWTKDQAVDMGPMGTYQTFKAQGEPMGGMMSAPPNLPIPHWNYYFNVDAIDPALERIKAAGGQVLNGPMEVPGGQWIIQGLDPQGAPFCLIGPKD